MSEISVTSTEVYVLSILRKLVPLVQTVFRAGALPETVGPPKKV